MARQNTHHRRLFPVDFVFFPTKAALKDQNVGLMFFWDLLNKTYKWDDGTTTLWTQKRERGERKESFFPPCAFEKCRLKSSLFHCASLGLKQSAYCGAKWKASVAFIWETRGGGNERRPNTKHTWNKEIEQEKGNKRCKWRAPLQKKAHKNLPPPPSGKERQRQNALKCAFF